MPGVTQLQLPKVLSTASIPEGSRDLGWLREAAGLGQGSPPPQIQWSQSQTYSWDPKAGGDLRLSSSSSPAALP